MKNYFQHIIILLKRLFLLILVFQLSRLIFLIFNYEYFDIDFIETIKIFFFGIRFDWFAIVIFNSIFIVLHFIPGNFKNNKTYQKTLFIYFITINSIVLIFNFIDIEYFKFTNKRITADFFHLISTGDDTWVLLPQFLKDFWYILILWIITIFKLWFIYKKVLKVKFSNIKANYKQVILQSFISALIITLMVFTVRGFSYRPTGIITAAKYTSSQNLPLILNTPFTILKTFYKDDIHAVNYLSDEEIEKVYSPVIKFNSEKTTYSNVVIIILESFSKEYIGVYNNGKTYTPFLDSLIEHSLSFENSFANGKKSMDVMPSIISGLPSLMNNPFITSSYSSDNLNSIAKVLKKYNYNTSFFHGGTNGTMGFDNFTKLAGIEEYYGKNEYPDIKDYDGKWGIFDEPFLQFFAKHLNNFSQPFFSVVFTLSSHHPYKVPDKYQNKFKGGNSEILKSIEYADFSLRKFFETALTMPWYNNTLFIITADHTSAGMSTYYHNNLGLYSVPVLYYHPGDSSLIGRNNTITQHTDIFPSIIDYLGLDEEIIAFGNSVFDANSEHFAINYINGIYQLIEGDYTLSFDGDKVISLYNFKTDSLLKNNLIKEEKSNIPKIIKMEKKIKAIIQQYNNRLLKNNLVVH